MEETSRPNPCGDALTQAKPSALSSTFEDAADVSAQANAKAMLSVFGFSADASKASHFFYRISTDKRVAVTDTNQYVTCCEQKGGCGIGFVSALIYGQGEYATGEESSASGSVSVPMAGAGGAVQLKVLHKRTVHGYLAALITVTGKGKAESALGPLGVIPIEATTPQRVTVEYEINKVRIQEFGDGEWALLNGHGELTENDFARRYEAATSNTELRPVRTRRNWPSVFISGGLTAGSLALTFWGATHLQRACTTDDVGCWNETPYPVSGGSPTMLQVPANGQCVGTDSCVSYVDTTQKTTNDVGYIALFGGGLLTLLTTPFFIASLLRGDGDSTDHVMTEDVARKYVTRYNRAILRNANEKVRREVQVEQGAELDLQPILVPGGLGLTGKF